MLSLLFPAGVCLLPTSTLAQVVPDATLPLNSIVTPQGDAFIIDGGTQAGGNLFHSFEQFSLPSGSAALFNPNSAIQNILTRVTGGSASSIDGLLQVNGGANLFLLNPNGILFGPNAQLNIGGSFWASTATTLNFADGTQFSTLGLPQPPSLTVSPPVSLQYGANPGEILVQGSQLNVPFGQSLSLLGGNVIVQGAALLAPEGGLQVSAIRQGQLSLSQPIPSEIIDFGDIQLQQSLLDTSGEGGGNVLLQGRGITLTDGSIVGSTTFGEQPGGNLTVQATEFIELRGIGPDGFPNGLLAETAGSGAGGNISILTGQLRLLDGAQLSTAALPESSGAAGNISVVASEGIELIGETFTPQGPLGSGIGATTAGTGDGGNVSVVSPRLIVQDGAQIGTSTRGEGNGGRIFVNAAEIGLWGTSPEGVPSGIGATSEGGTGDGGEIEIVAGRLSVRDGAQISALTAGAGAGGRIFIQAAEVDLSGVGFFSEEAFPSGIGATTFGAGDGGTIEMVVGSLRMSDRAQVTTTTAGDGNAGNINIRAELVDLTGDRTGIFAQVDPEASGEGSGVRVEAAQVFLREDAQISTATLGTGSGGTVEVNTRQLRVETGGQVSALTLGESPGGTVIVNAAESIELSGVGAESFPSGLFSQTQGAGNAGDLRVSTPRLRIREGAKISVSGESLGNAGFLEIDADRLRLETGATLTGETVSGQGGDIRIRSNDMRLRGGSQISTTAGTAELPGDGGNITINTQTLVGLEDSDITANSFEGFGGRIAIATQGIFGLEERDELTPGSDITAFSQINPELSGTTLIQTPDIDPTAGLVELPDDLVDVAGLIDQNLCAIARRSQFTITGRGGLPPSPNDAIAPDAVWEDLSIPASVTSRQSAIQNRAISHRPIIEAQGWVVEEGGDIVLVANSPQLSNRGIEMLPQCDPSQSATQVKALSADRTITIQGFEVVGSRVFSPQQLAAVTNEFVNQPLSFAELLEVRSRLTQLYTDNHYITSRAVLVPQRLEEGVVRIEIVEGSLEDIQVQGTTRLDSNYVRSRLKLAGATPVNRQRLLEALQLLQLDPLIDTISAELSAGIYPGTHLLQVTVREARSFDTQFIADNGRSPGVGSVRRRVNLTEGNLLGFGDRLALGYTNTDGSHNFDVGYSIPINAYNGRLSFTHSRATSRIVEAPFDPLDIKARSRTYDLTLRQPVLLSPYRELAMGLTASRTESDTSILGQPYPLSLGANADGETRISALRFFQEWTRRGEREIFALRSQFSWGLGLLGATINNDAPDSRFLAWRGQGQWVRAIAPDTLVVLRGDLQLASDLVPVEQFSLGGLGTVRGYRQDARLTDNGVFGSAEVRLPIYRLPQRGLSLQIAPFVDVGRGWNRTNRQGLDPRTLASVGLGLRLQLGSFSARLDWGLPLVNLDSRERTWQERGLHFSIGSNPF